MSESRESLQRDRMRFAFKHVCDLESGKRETFEKATTRLKGLPVEIRTCGLSVALATLLRENSQESKALANCLSDWLLDKSPVKVLEPGRREKEKTLALLEELIEVDRATYLAAQVDALELCEQLKLLSSAMFEAKKNGHGAP